jgi:hypothetical protein
MVVLLVLLVFEQHMLAWCAAAQLRHGQHFKVVTMFTVRSSDGCDSFILSILR